LKNINEDSALSHGNKNDEGLSEDMKKIKAEAEKNKGNEAMKAGDYKEAL